MMQLTAYKAKWAQQTKAGVQFYKDGINNTSVAPGQLAAAQKAKWLANVTAAADKFANNVSAIGLQQWKDAANLKSVRIPSGVDQALTKSDAAWTKMLTDTETVRQQVLAMPNNSIEDAIARATTYIRNRAAIAKA